MAIMEIFRGLFHLIGIGLILVASIIYFSRTQKPEAMIMVIGSGIGVIVSIFYMVFNYMGDMGTFSGNHIGTVFKIINTLRTLGWIGFGVGLLLLASKANKDS